MFSSIRNKLSVVSCNLIRLSSFVAMLHLFDFSQVIWSHPHAFCGMDLWIDISIKTISVGCHFWEWDMIWKVNYIMTGCHFDMYIVCLSTCKCAQSVHGDLIDWLSLNGEWFYNVLRNSTVVIQGGDWLIDWYWRLKVIDRYGYLLLSRHPRYDILKEYCYSVYLKIHLFIKWEDYFICKFNTKSKWFLLYQTAVKLYLMCVIFQRH